MKTFAQQIRCALAPALLAAGLCIGAGAAYAQSTTNTTAGPKILRYAFPVAETTFDPAQISDLYSRTVVAGMFDAPFEFAYMAEPARLRINTAAAMPEIAEDFKTFTIRIKPGIYFADDPAFKGQKRELTAEDYVYSLKRHYDPRWKSANLYILENAKLVGMDKLRQHAVEGKQPFNYDTVVEGLRTLDRYTFQMKLEVATPRLMYNFADGSFTGALAREVVEAYGDKVGEHPVGTGPFVLKSWTRSSRIVLAKNPNYRQVLYDEEAIAGDTRLARDVKELKGKPLPLLDEVHISIIEEAQPRWLSFLNEEQDVMFEMPAEFAPTAVPNNKLAPNLAKKGITMVRAARADVAVSYFGMENPVVGGYEPHKVALRRAISLAVDVEREIRLVRRSQAILAQGIIAPGTWGYDPSLKTEMGDFSRPRAKALLDLHGYLDKDGDGWREQPNGEPLVLEYATSPDQVSRQLSELWKKNMDAIGLRIEFKVAKWPENLRSSRAGKLMMWGVGWSAGAPDGDTFLALGYGPNKGGANHARFNLPAFNVLYEKQRGLADGPERAQAMHDATRLMVTYMPYKVHVHRISTDLVHPRVVGYHRNLFVRDFWRYVDVDTADSKRRSGDL